MSRGVAREDAPRRCLSRHGREPRRLALRACRSMLLLDHDHVQRAEEVLQGRHPCEMALHKRAHALVALRRLDAAREHVMRVGGSPLLLHCHSRKRRREPQREGPGDGRRGASPRACLGPCQASQVVCGRSHLVHGLDRAPRLLELGDGLNLAAPAEGVHQCRQVAAELRRSRPDHALRQMPRAEVVPRGREDLGNGVWEHRVAVGEDDAGLQHVSCLAQLLEEPLVAARHLV